MEYLFASYLLDKASVPRVAVTPSAGGAYAVVFWRNLAAAAPPSLELSTDGGNWTAGDPADVAAAGAITRQAGLPVGRVELTIPAASPSLFVRFVEKP
jgi:hypothetical protein